MEQPKSPVVFNLRCACTVCGAVVGITTSLISHLTVQEIFKIKRSENKEETEALDEIQARLDAGEEFRPFIPIQLAYNMATRTLSFPGWCPNCGMIQVELGLDDLVEIVESEIGRRNN